MRCSRCQHENRSGRRFCSECGASLALRCPSCGFSHEAGEKFCGGCGQPLGAAQPREPSTFVSPETYTPKHLAEKILTSKAALEGERKQVTVLFADLKGSMELLADRDPEEARKLLDPVLERMMEAVHHYEGTVNQVMGDGIMALFGAPLAHEDHAVRACYAALRMQESVRQYADGIRRDEGVSIQIRVGLNSGDVVVRSIGSDLRMDYTAVGQTTHLAARMEQLAAPGSIVMAPETLRLAEGYVAVKPLGPVNIKGLSAPVEVYEVTGAGAVRTRLQRSAARGFTRFVGRDAELEQLRGALERAGAGHGQVVAVVGEPGVGKSRLFYEFVHSHRFVRSNGETPPSGLRRLARGGVRLRLLRHGHSIPPGDRPAQGVLRDRRARRRPQDPGEGNRQAPHPRRDVAAAAAGAPRLARCPRRGSRWQAIDPPQRRRHTHDAVRRLLLRESQRQPLCLVFEDLHWIDAETQAVLDGLVESLPAARLLLLVNYRPEYRHAWGSKTYYSQARIDPLPTASASELLDALLGADASLRPLTPLLIERTEGNPFFLEESVRTLVETGMLAGEPGRYRLARPLGSIQVPATVQAVLAARIDRLPPRRRACCSRVGRRQGRAVRAAARDRRVARGGVAHRARAPPGRRVPLRDEPLPGSRIHLQARAHARGGLRRRAPRAAARAARQDRGGDRDTLSRSTRRACRAAGAARPAGEVWPKAVAYLRQAAAKAGARSANREAVSCLEQALGALPHLPQSPETREQAIDLRLDLQAPLNGLGEIERLLDYLREAEPLAGALGDLPRMGRVAAHMAFGSM